MAEQQAQVQAQLVAALQNVGDQMTWLNTTMGAPGVAKMIKPFDRNPKQFTNWIKSIENVLFLTG